MGLVFMGPDHKTFYEFEYELVCPFYLFFSCISSFSSSYMVVKSNPLTRNSNINLAHATLFLGIIQKPDIRGGVKSYKILYLF